MRPLAHTAIALSLMACTAAAQGQPHAKGAIVEYVEIPQVSQPVRGVRADTYRGGKVGQGHGGHRTNVDSGIFTAPQCPPNFSGMFRGTLYCMNGKTLP